MKKMMKLIPFLIILYICAGHQGNTTHWNIQKKENKQIELKGEVVQPGICEADWNASIQDILDQCGGVKESAYLEQINLTQVPNNGDVIVIAKKPTNTCISINTADAKTLDQLPGIGPKMAERIIQERTIAPFQTLEDLKRVKGIGDKSFEKMKDQICL